MLYKDTATLNGTAIDNHVNLGGGTSVRMGNSELTNYDAREVLQAMVLIVRNANDKKIKL